MIFSWTRLAVRWISRLSPAPVLLSLSTQLFLYLQSCLLTQHNRVTQFVIRTFD